MLPEFPPSKPYAQGLCVYYPKQKLAFLPFFNLITELLISIQIRPRKIKAGNRPGNAIAFYSCICLAQIKCFQEIKNLHNTVSGICFSALTSSNIHSSFYLFQSLSHFLSYVDFCRNSIVFPGQQAQGCKDEQLRDVIWEQTQRCLVRCDLLR